MSCAQVRIANRKFVEAKEDWTPPFSKVETVHDLVRIDLQLTPGTWAILQHTRVNFTLRTRQTGLTRFIRLYTSIAFNIGNRSCGHPRGEVEVPGAACPRDQTTETDAETTQVRFQNYFMDSFHFRGGWKYYASCPLQTTLSTILTLRNTRVHFCPQHWLFCVIFCFY